MAYGAKSSDIKDVQYLSHGEFENGRIDNIEVDPAKKRARGDETDDVCDIIFRHLQGQFQLRVFNPDLDEDEARRDKAQEYASKLFAYIAKKLTGKDQEVPDTITGWKELTAWFLNAVGPREEYRKVALNFKLVGNVYNGKANIQVTKYFGWLERADSGKKPKFSSNEITANNAYDKFIKERTPKTGGTTGGESASGGEEEFLF